VHTIQRGDRYSESKYFGCYRATVLDNDDPRKLGRLILQVPEIFGVDLKTDWAFPKGGYLSAKNSRSDIPVKPPDQPVLNVSRDGDKGMVFGRSSRLGMLAGLSGPVDGGLSRPAAQRHQCLLERSRMRARWPQKAPIQW
jgi:hypothetical protein